MLNREYLNLINVRGMTNSCLRLSFILHCQGTFGFNLENKVGSSFKRCIFFQIQQAINNQ